jgi:hypothetical protein
VAVIPTITFGGTDINTFGVYLATGDSGWLSAPDLEVPVIALGGRHGAVVGRYATVKPRTLVLPVIVTGATLTLLRGYEATLKAYLNTDVLVRINDGVNAYENYGRLTSISLSPYRVPVSPRSDGRLTFVMADPYWRATSDTTEAIDGTPNTLALGGAPVSDWVLTITATGGTVIDVTITLGAYTLVWTGTIADTKALVISAAAFTVKNDGATAISTYSGGFPVLDPTAAPAVSAVKASGTGTLGGSLVYRKRYS